jgi:ectoine hydroxylase-related dioxygenase (phytanoyl-CoA dioxygenase family)
LRKCSSIISIFNSRTKRFSLVKTGKMEFYKICNWKRWNSSEKICSDSETRRYGSIYIKTFVKYKKIIINNKIFFNSKIKL